jgi:alpha-tubulin suppressor-like RCC1 family protein/ferric-dicitrate binding protein FerR (iron transport regulator)
VNHMSDELIEPMIHRYLEGDCPPEVVEELRAAMDADPAVARLLFKRAGELNDLIDVLREEQGAAVEPAVLPEPEPRLRAPGVLWQRWLALAASLTLVAGGVWWFSQPQAGALELRVAEVRGTVSGFRVQGSGGPEFGVTESPSHRVAKAGEGANTQRPTPNAQQPSGEAGSTLATRHSTLKIGDILRPGDGIDVGANGYVKLVYPDRTQVELQQNTRLRVTLGEGENKKAKRLALDGGKMVCSAVLQKKAFEIQTRHAVSRVVGTRFRLGVTEAASRLAVQEGKMALIQGEKSLLVSAGESAVATEQGMEMVRDVVYAWGQNQYGQLGNGTMNDSPNPVLVPGLDRVVAVAAGNSHTVALKDDGSVWAWGNNRWGQLGNGTTNASLLPILVAGINDITAIAVGGTYAMALNADGTVWAWGANHAGQLGNGTINDSLRPMQVKLPDGSSFSGVRALAAGLGHAVALKGDGSVWTWGLNDQSQIRGGSNKYYGNPVSVKLLDGTALTDCLAIAAGGRHTLALRADRTVWAWGDNNEGQLGDGHAYCVSSIPVQVKAFDGTCLSNVTALAAGLSHTVALKTDGTVWGWGSYGATYSGVTRSTVTAEPMTAPDGAAVFDALAIATSLRRTLVLKKDGTVWGCGYKMERGTGAEQSSLVQVVWPDGSGVQKIIAIAAGDSYSVAIREE